MGQTLTHGVYLPDEGERNCYSGLAANWQILDGSVGTIAAHTAALAGKAPLVHTHTKSDITDFPAYGTTAGTICEGNDSRLSDARTPVAHTHTKSDVTDLLNSNFIPSANNSYDLGSSSYQWNNIYSKGYYYNGVAWGLDKYNIWTNAQAYKLTGTEVGSTTSGYISLFFIDKNNASIGFQRISVYSDGRTCFSWKIYNTDNNSQSISSSLEYYITKAEVKVFAPVENGEVNLGTSTNKWKSFNGTNPGALSLPNLSITRTDISSSFLYFGNNVTNNYAVTADGYIFLKLDNTNQVTCYVVNASSTTQYAQTYKRDSDGLLYITFPVLKNTVFRTIWYTNSTVSVQSAYFIPCQGNV